MDYSLKQNWIVEFETWDSYHADTKEEAIEKFRKQYGSSAEIKRIIKDG